MCRCVGVGVGVGVGVDVWVWVWMCGCVGVGVWVWVCGCVGVWVCGCVGVCVGVGVCVCVCVSLFFCASCFGLGPGFCDSPRTIVRLINSKLGCPIGYTMRVASCLRYVYSWLCEFSSLKQPTSKLCFR